MFRHHMVFMSHTRFSANISSRLTYSEPGSGLWRVLGDLFTGSWLLSTVSEVILGKVIRMLFTKHWTIRPWQEKQTSEIAAHIWSLALHYLYCTWSILKCYTASIYELLSVCTETYLGPGKAVFCDVWTRTVISGSSLEKGGIINKTLLQV